MKIKKPKLWIVFCLLIVTLCMALLVACNETPGNGNGGGVIQPEDKIIPDKPFYDVSKMWTNPEFDWSSHVVSIEHDGYDATTGEVNGKIGRIKIITKYDIAEGATMTTTVVINTKKTLFTASGKPDIWQETFDSVSAEVTGANKDNYDITATEDYGNVTGGSNNPSKIASGAWLRLPRSGQTATTPNITDKNNVNNFNFLTVGTNAACTDEFKQIGTASFETVEYAVAAYRFIASTKAVFGSYESFSQAKKVDLKADWNYDGGLNSSAGATGLPKIISAYETENNFILITTSGVQENGANARHDQVIYPMIKIGRANHKVTAMDYAFYHISEYIDLNLYTSVLNNAKANFIGKDALKLIDLTFDSNDLYESNATLSTNSVTNSVNCALKYYQDVLKK